MSDSMRTSVPPTLFDFFSLENPAASTLCDLMLVPFSSLIVRSSAS